MMSCAIPEHEVSAWLAEQERDGTDVGRWLGLGGAALGEPDAPRRQLTDEEIALLVKDDDEALGGFM